MSVGSTVTSAKAKPRSDAYSGMLLISLIALLGGCALLYLDYSRYPPGDPPKVQRSDSGGAPPGPKPAP